ncbi:hypothetical protein [Caballeronia sp. ATUFL_M1_KS5A]|uniref:hypothetical protein n=1 Tax=Caballeronia sp. ATUFL_M1_KS5A TaxID=2921778 RepID=UPI00202928E3|nr:hypothetical protein [Caballeronia sp. ATUFL_M1_KS5A]
MTAQSYELMRPLILPSGKCQPDQASRFARVFGDDLAAITGERGQHLGNVTIRELHNAWWGHGARKGFAGDNAIVHWPLKTKIVRAFFSAQLSAAAVQLDLLDSQSGCLLDRFRRPNTPIYEWVILGPAGTQVGTHRDMFGTASWNLLLSGRKVWRFWAPEASPLATPPALEFEQGPNDLVWTRRIGGMRWSIERPLFAFLRTWCSRVLWLRSHMQQMGWTVTFRCT